MLTSKSHMISFFLSFFLLFFNGEMMSSSLVDSQDENRENNGVIPLDILLEERTVNGDHAEKFSKILTIDNQGRIKPYHTFASEILRKISRKERIKNQTPTQVVLGMTIDPLLWQMIPVIKVKDVDILNLLNANQDLVPFVSFFNDNEYILTPYVESAYAKKPIDRSKFDKHIIEVDERVNICSMLFSGNLIKLFPGPDNTWSTDVFMQIPGLDSSKTSFQYIYRDLVFSAFDTGSWQEANSILKFIDNQQNEYAALDLPSVKKINAEIFYNNLNPFGWTRLFIFYFLGGCLLLLFLIMKIFYSNKLIDWSISGLHFFIFSFFIFHLLALALRWYVSGHAPWSDAYESVIFIAFATMLAGMVFSRKSRFSLAASCVVASMLLFVANINWVSPELTNLVPVLKSYWLMIHVSVITSSYGFFGLCAFIGFLNLILIIPKKGKKIDANIQDLTIINEQSMTIGLFLLTVGTFLGGVWANESWGRYWGWDPKAPWALVSIIVYALILHIRLLKSNSYIFFFNFCALFGFGSILMTYFGVNYYLDGLHSYAAGDAFPVPTFVPWTILILGILSIISFIRFKNSIR